MRQASVLTVFVIVLSVLSIACGSAAPVEPVPIATIGEPPPPAQEPAAQTQSTSTAHLPRTPGRHEVARVMGSAADDVRLCTQGETGTIAVRINIISSGMVEMAELGHGELSDAHRECVLNVIRGLQFSPFTRPTFRVSFPYRVGR